MASVVLVPCLSNHKLKKDQPKPNTCKVRFSMPPEKTKKRRHHATSRHNTSSSTTSSSTIFAGPHNSHPEPAPTPTKLLVAQLASPTLNTRSEFDLAYKISKSTTSIAVKQLATTLCRGDIAETTSRLTQNQSDLDALIEVVQEQVEKVKKMERDWRPELPSTTKEFATDLITGKNKAMREAIKHFDELKWEYERIIKCLDWIEELKVEREHLLEDRKYMCGHFD
ncbi:hypothetical protein TCE0_018f06130 [Talaromyces pinophilus]|uniref:Uncharacterized protein n=1 Tax=Talaromyces pinophilus TaxID=128442 RepID=A0A510NXD2_TALPI|nr:hypothetical protein TCE0_018f06130 [Talaromyces pinophilus]